MNATREARAETGPLSRVMMLVALAALLFAVVCGESLHSHHASQTADTLAVSAAGDSGGCTSETDPACAKLVRGVTASAAAAPSVLPAVTGDLTGSDFCAVAPRAAAVPPHCDVERPFLNVWVI